MLIAISDMCGMSRPDGWIIRRKKKVRQTTSFRRDQTEGRIDRRTERQDLKASRQTDRCRG